MLFGFLGCSWRAWANRFLPYPPPRFAPCLLLSGGYLMGVYRGCVAVPVCMLPQRGVSVLLLP